MAKLLEAAIKNSRRKKYHKAGMDFSRVQRGGASRLLAKGQQYSASSDLSRVVFNDKWGFNGSTKYLDATVLLMKGKTIAETIDYSNTSSSDGAVRHSGDQIGNHSGTHTIDIDLGALDKNTTSLVFVLSAWASATLSDISSASVAFRDAEASEEEEPLCQYRLQAHDKVASLTSVVMCKLYRKDDSWHVLAIGDAHKGDASNYGPIYEAVKKYV
jgi:stress response protein SCP2